MQFLKKDLKKIQNQRLPLLKKKQINYKQINRLIEVNKELISLNETLKKSIKNDESKILSFKNDLKNINLKLWDIEDGKRSAEKNNKFDEKFIELARSVYKFNDERAKIKLAINNALGSNIKEVKSYEQLVAP